MEKLDNIKVDLITKPYTDINIGDIKIGRPTFNGNTNCIEFDYFHDYDPRKDLYATYVDIVPGSVRICRNLKCYGGSRNINEDASHIMKDMLPPDIAKKFRLMFNDFRTDIQELYDLYKHSMHKKTLLQLYYIDDEHLNVDLKEGDVIYKVDKYTSNVSILELKNNPTYNETIENDIKQDTLFYDYLTETGKDYSVTLHGHHFIIGPDELHSIPNTLERFSIGAKPGSTYLVKGLTLDWIDDRIINITKKFYDNIHNLLGIPLPENIIKHHNGKKYSNWEVPNNIIDDIDTKINRTEYVAK